jgi:hypothetical protein
MPRVLVAVLLIGTLTGTATAQPKAGKVQPDQLPIGTVYTGATVEASFMVFEPGTDPTIKFEVTAPKFVKVLNKETHHQLFGGPGNDFVCGSVSFAVDTTTANEFQGEIAVKLGKTTAKVPVSVTVKAQRPGLIRVLVVGSPFERYSTSDGTTFTTWTDLARDTSLDVHSLLIDRGKPVLREFDLTKFHCVLMTADGVYFQTPADLKRVRAYAEGGGRVVVTANHFFRGTVEKANAVLDGYGVEIRDEEAGAGGMADVTLGKQEFAPELVRAGVESARFFRASPVVVTDPKAGRVVVQAVGVGRPGDGFAAVAKAGKGEVVVLGESLWWNWLSKDRAQGTDNAKLFRWLLSPPKVA